MTVYNPSASGGSPGGSDTQVQFNDSGSFGGDAGFTYNKTTENVSVNNIFTNSTSTVSAGGTTVLTAASSRIQILTGSSTQNYQLPDATTLPKTSEVFVFNNNSSSSLIIKNNGGTTLYTIPTGGAVSCDVTSIATSNGVWDFHALAPSSATWSSGITGLTMNTVLSTSPSIGSGASSATVPAFIPQHGTLTTGYSGDNTHLYGVIGGATALTSTANDTTAKEFIAAQTALGTTTSDGFLLQNTTAATNGSQQISPTLHFSGRGYNSGGGGSSQSIDFYKQLLPVQGASGATGTYLTKIQRAGGGVSTIHSQSTTGEIAQTILTAVSATTGYEMSANFANSDTQTTQHMKFSNAGTNTWLTFYFTSVQKGAFGVDSSGIMRFYGSGNRYIFHSGVTGSTGIAEIYSGGFYNTGGNFNSGRVTAGNNTTSPPTTFSNYGSTSLKTTIINTPTTLTDDYTQVLVDCSTNNTCTGTPTYDCSHWSNQTDCELYNAHGGCSWFAGNACSAFDNEFGMGTCTGISGCSASTSSCSPYNSDQTTCEAADDSYGGNCTWDAGSNTCPAQNCASCAGAGCTPNLGGNCNDFNDGGGDGTACNAAPCGSCSYDSGSGVCSGSYFISCDGDNTTPSCNGTFYTGACSGTYGAGCSGSSTCAGVGYTDCTSEAGCSQSSGVDITMPASPIEQTYWIAKDYTSGTLTILPNSGQTINNTTSITSSSTAGVGWMLTWFDSKSNWAIMSKH